MHAIPSISSITLMFLPAHDVSAHESRLSLVLSWDVDWIDDLLEVADLILGAFDLILLAGGVI